MKENGTNFSFVENNPTQFDILHSVRADIAQNLKTFLSEAQSSGFTEEIDRMINEDPEIEKSYKQFMKALDKNGQTLGNQMMSMMIDPDYQVDSVENYAFPHERVRPEMLRRAGNSIPGHMIKNHRIQQFAEFGDISDGKIPGFKIVLIDKEKTPTNTEKKKLAEAEKAFKNNLFYVPNDTKPNLQKFINFAYNDYFDLDKIAFAIIRTRASGNKRKGYKGIPIALQLLDAGTIYHIVPRNLGQPNYDQHRWDTVGMHSAMEDAGLMPKFYDDYRYIQVDRYGQRRGIYKESEMVLAHAFGTSDVKEQFMGFGIVEKSLKVLRYIMDSIIYNYTRRSTQTMPKGMIALTGATEDGFSREEMALFRKMIWAISSGKKNQWKYPVIGMPKQAKADFVKFHESSKEMEDFMWWSTLMSIFCTYAGLSPEDINMASNKNTVGKQRLFDKKEEEGGMVRSQDMGLRFFLNHIESVINSAGIAEEITGLEGVQFKFSGLDVQDEIKKVELDQKRLQTDTSINDLLALQDKKPFEYMLGDVNVFDIPAIQNPQIQQSIMEVYRQQQMSQDQEGGEGEPGEGEPQEGYPWDSYGDKGDEGLDDEEGGGSPEPPVANKSMKKSNDVLIRIVD